MEEKYNNESGEKDREEWWAERLSSRRYRGGKKVGKRGFVEVFYFNLPLFSSVCVMETVTMCSMYIYVYVWRGLCVHVHIVVWIYIFLRVLFKGKKNRVMSTQVIFFVSNKSKANLLLPPFSRYL